jgi:quinol monooxygenase YgiN
MLKVGLLATMHAKAGKEAELAQFLASAVQMANQERGTTVWFAFRTGDGAFGIFDAFGEEDGRQAHLNGPIAKALMAKASELLSEPPKIEKADVLAAKVPS